MLATEVISHLQRRGITLRVVAGSLKIRGAEKLSDRERASLKAHRNAILQALMTTPTAPIATDNRASPTGAAAPTRPFSRAAVNRRAMPTIAAVVDQLRVVFGPVRVIYAEEGGLRLGTAPGGSEEGRS